MNNLQLVQAFKYQNKLFVKKYTCIPLKHWYRGDDPNKKVPLHVVGAFGAFAGACSVYGNTPIDVVKTRLQVTFPHIHGHILLTCLIVH